MSLLEIRRTAAVEVNHLVGPKLEEAAVHRAKPLSITIITLFVPRP